MRELIITSGVACLVFTAATCSNVGAAETDEQSIRDTYEAWVGATNEKDIEKWSAFVDVSESGEMAWSRGECKATFTGPGDTTATGRSRWLKVWIKQPNGSWRCRVNTWRNVDQL